MDSINLSPRLTAVAKFVPQNARLADIGSDHGYLPAHLLLNQRINFAVVGEVAKGPFENAQHELKRRRLADQSVARLADGLAAVQDEDNIDTVTIAGMGGLLISDILKDGQKRFSTLILQPNTDENIVRQWLMRNSYSIVAESIVQEDKHFYEIIVAHPGEQQLSEKELLFGPYLQLEKSEAFVSKWQKELQRIDIIFERLTAAGKENTSTYHEWKARYKMIQEVLS